MISEVSHFGKLALEVSAAKVTWVQSGLAARMLYAAREKPNADWNADPEHPGNEEEMTNFGKKI
eukprot:1587985-Amphidinium_carterae.1